MTLRRPCAAPLVMLALVAAGLVGARVPPAVIVAAVLWGALDTARARR